MAAPRHTESMKLLAGRAEALLIAAYGKGLKMKSDFPCISEQFESIPYN
ncbi:hypothetical protein CK203_110351 [Vitis vinifera]|uniref:Uncharacterized protein n=1 Tax=Vitis vinifera TaxID=29760 RepID=A0A438CGD9_VITVI|nr:hypothetical protein CK203_110351 [Vitis vinifera]